MKTRFHRICYIFLFFTCLNNNIVLAQAPGCPAIDAGTDQNLNCSTNCTNLTATYPQTGQTTAYTVSSVPFGFPVSINTGTAFSLGTDDIWSGIINIPFTFCFFGNSYTQLVVGSNGLLSFNTANANGYCPWSYTASCPSAALPINSIFGAYHDIDPSICGTIRYTTSGTAPCRMFIFSFSQVCHFSCTSLKTTQQIVLYETTNIIEVYIQDKPTCSSWNSGNALIGIQNAAGNTGYTPPGRNTGSWTVTTSEGWRFTPSGPSNVTMAWFQGGNQIGTTPTINVCPTGNTAYVAQAIYTHCNGTQITATDTVNLNIAGGFTTNLVTSNTGCSGCSGGAVITTSGGTSPFTFDIGNGSQGNGNFLNLCAGNYTVSITDAGGCTGTVPVTINSSGSIAVSVSPVNPSICPGSAISLTASGATTYSWSPATGLSSTTGATVTASPTSTTTYTVVGTTGTCADSTTVNVNTNSSLSITGTTTDATCSGNDGAVDITVSGGTTPYAFLWSNSAVTEDIDSLDFGNYSVTVTDSGSCTETQSFTIILLNSTLAVGSGSQTNVSCNLGNDGQIVIIATGGTTPYTYQWFPNVSSSDTANNLTAGTYIAMAIDSIGCKDTMSFLITQPPFLTSTGSQTNVSCYGGNDGNAYVYPSGGTTGYSYFWSPAPGGGQGTDYATGLSAGNYSVEITDTLGCTSMRTFSITEPQDSLSIIPMQQNISCNGGSNGAALVTVSGGTTGYSYTWNPSVSSTGIATNLPAGNYDVTVTDTNGCTKVHSFIITEPSILTSSVTSFNVNCNSACNGSAFGTASGGTSPYIFKWNDPDSTIADSALNLCAGNYNVNVTDFNGCTSFSNFVITEPSQFTIVRDSTDSNCQQPDGSAGVTVSGSTGPYTYLWDVNANNQTTTTASNLTDGIYCVTITDANGCDTTACITVWSKPAPLTGISHTKPLCFGDCNGYANSVIVSQSAPPYTYLWSNGATTATIFNLCTGNYTVTVTDNVGCFDIQTVFIDEPSPVTVAAGTDTIICISGTATLSAIADGGTPGASGYELAWDNGFTGTSQDVQLLSNTCYIVTATDDNGCQSLPGTQCVNLYEPVTVTAALPSPVCFGNAAVLSASLTGGNTNNMPVYSWTDAFFLEIGSGATISTTPPGAYPDSVLYMVIASDNKCSPSDTDSVYVKFHPNPSVDFRADNTYDCEPLLANLTNLSSSTAGLSGCVWSMGDTTVSTGCTNFSHTYLNAGNYTVKLIVTDGNNCVDSIIKNNYIKVNPLPIADFSASPQTTNVQNMMVQFTDLSSGNGSALRQWNWIFYDNDQSSVLGDSVSQNPKFNFSSTENNDQFVFFMEDTGNYPVTLIVTTEHSCVDSITQYIRVDGIYYMNVPNAFTPDEDGINDIFYPVGVGIEPTANYRFYIFNRWGDMVFQSSDLNKGWDGKSSKGAKVPEGVYVWRIDAEDVLGEMHKKIIGHVTLLRR